MRAYSLGILHFHVGMPMSANPFNVHLDTLSHDMYNHGWVTAKLESEEQ